MATPLTPQYWFVSEPELISAYQTWCTYFGSAGSDSRKLFWKFLGYHTEGEVPHPRWGQHGGRVYWFGTDGLEQFNKLTGPYGAALVNVYKIQHADARRRKKGKRAR